MSSFVANMDLKHRDNFLSRCWIRLSDFFFADSWELNSEPNRQSFQDRLNDFGTCCECDLKVKVSVQESRRVTKRFVGNLHIRKKNLSSTLFFIAFL